MSRWSASGSAFGVGSVLALTVGGAVYGASLCLTLDVRNVYEIRFLSCRENSCLIQLRGDDANTPAVVPAIGTLQAEGPRWDFHWLAAFSGFTGDGSGYAPQMLCQIDVSAGLPARSVGFRERLNPRRFPTPEHLGDYEGGWCTLDLCAPPTGAAGGVDGRPQP